jgi:ribosome-associated toxin RatA of RatAB toxin-antitoxin module
MADDAHEHIDVHASPARCFALAADFEGYPEWTSDVHEVRVLERDGAGRAERVELRVAGLGRRVRYVLDYDFTEAPHAFSWSLVEGDMLRVLEGRYAFSPIERGTRVDYTMRVEAAVPLPGLLKRRASGMIMGNALRDLKRAAEQDADEDEDDGMAADEAAGEAPGEAPGEAAGMAADGSIGREEPGEPPSDVSAVGLHPDAVPFDAVGTEEHRLPAPSILESVLTELLGAVPEVKDHVLEAADALLDAAKALIDAADRVVRQQRGED